MKCLSSIVLVACLFATALSVVTDTSRARPTRGRCFQDTMIVHAPGAGHRQGHGASNPFYYAETEEETERELTTDIRDFSILPVLELQLAASLAKAPLRWESNLGLPILLAVERHCRIHSSLSPPTGLAA